MAQINRTTFKSNTQTLYADNTNGDISAADLRQQMDNIADSAPFKTTGNTTAPTANDDASNTGGNGAFEVGDTWIDDMNGQAWTCVDATATEAVWQLQGSGTFESGVDVSGPGLEVEINVDQLDFAGPGVSITPGPAGSAEIFISGGSGLTDTEVKTAYENNADTNAFTDVEQTKLSGIEANATSDQTGAEIEAALDAELGNTDWKTGGSTSYDIQSGFQSMLAASEIFQRIFIARNITFPANFIGSGGTININPTNTFILTIEDDTVEIGSITISTSGVLTFETTGNISIDVDAGSILTFTGPSVADSTASDMILTLLSNLR